MLITTPLVLCLMVQQPAPGLNLSYPAVKLERFAKESSRSSWSGAAAAVDDSGNLFFALIPSRRTERFTLAGERSYRGEQIHYGLEGSIPIPWTITTSQSGYWPGTTSPLSSSWGNTISFIAVTGFSSLLIETQFGESSKNRRFSGVSEVRFDKRGRDANIDLLFPQDRTGHYDIVHTIPGKNEISLLVSHQIGGTSKTVMEAYSMRGRSLKKLTKGYPAMYSKLVGRTIAHTKSSSGKTMEVADLDPLGTRVLIVQGRDWAEMGLATKSILRGRFVDNGPSFESVRYLRGEAYANGYHGEALYRLDRKAGKWVKIGSYKLLGASASEQFVLVRHATDGALWMLNLGGRP